MSLLIVHMHCRNVCTTQETGISPQTLMAFTVFHPDWSLNTMRSRPSCCRINALRLARAQPHSSLLRFPPSVRVACAGRRKDRCCVLLCVDQLGAFSFYYFIFCIFCARVCARQRRGWFSSGGGGQTTSKVSRGSARMPAPVCGHVNFMTSISLSS